VTLKTLALAACLFALSTVPFVGGTDPLAAQISPGAEARAPSHDVVQRGSSAILALRPFDSGMLYDHPVLPADTLEAATARERARLSGVAAAEDIGTRAWFGRGFLAGTVGGPLGAGLVAYVAGTRPTPDPEEVRDAAAEGDSDLVAAFDEGFRGQIHEQRRRNALRGGIVGTAVFAFLLIQLTDFGQPGGVPGSGPGDPLISGHHPR